MVREFKLVNDKKQEFSLMDIHKFALLTNPSGLGVNFNIDYEKIGNTFVSTSKKIAQNSINAIINFINYDNYKKFIDYIMSSEKLRLVYKVPYEKGAEEFFRDIEIELIGKSEMALNGVISEQITIRTLSLWYKENQTTFFVKVGENDFVWDFKWNPKFVDFESHSFAYMNDGHVDASVKLILNSEAVNPILQVATKDEILQSIKFNTSISNEEQFIYCSKENEFTIEKIDADGNVENLFNLNVIDFENDNVLKIPRNEEVFLKLKSDIDIKRAELIVYTYYLAV